MNPRQNQSDKAGLPIILMLVIVVLIVLYYQFNPFNPGSVIPPEHDLKAQLKTSNLSALAAIPSEIPGGLNATRFQQATFVWAQFIALNWPAKQDASSPSGYTRGMPDLDGNAGTKGPVVWQTFKHRVETYPYVSSSTGLSIGSDTVNEYPVFNSKICYPYKPHAVQFSNPPIAVALTKGTADATLNLFLNLDENAEVGDAKLFAK